MNTTRLKTLGAARGSKTSTLQFFFYLTFFFGYCVEEGRIKRTGVRVVERGVCILKTGSNQASPLSNLTLS